jgi:hypothetical protein
MTYRALLASIFSCMLALASTTGLAADKAREVHGEGDAYAAPGVALAWGVLRGTSEATTTVVIRIVADPGTYAGLSAVASNPFSQKSADLLRRGPVSARTDVRVLRSQFADTPRTEWRFYPSASPAASDVPALIVFYLGVPDTTPEFTSEAALDAYFADRFARMRNAPAGK